MKRVTKSNHERSEQANLTTTTMFVIKKAFSHHYIVLGEGGEHHWGERKLAQRFETIDEAKTEITWILQHESLVGDLEIVKWESKR